MSSYDEYGRARGQGEVGRPGGGGTPPARPGYGQPWGYDEQPHEGDASDRRLPDGDQRPSAGREARAAARAERARAKAMRPWYAKKRWWIAGSVAALVVVAAVAGSGGDDGGPERDQAAGATDGGQDVYAVGRTAHTGDFDVTLHQVQDPYAPTNQFETPQPGQRFVAVEVEVRNTGDERLAMSTLLGAEVTDSQNRPWNVALAGTDLPHLDGEVGPGEARRGWIVFGVAQDATGLQLRLKGNLTATGSLFELG